MAKKTVYENKRYKFTGQGTGVPGLPHLVTKEEAEQLGQAENLAAAVKAGNYQAEQAQAEEKAPEKED